MEAFPSSKGLSWEIHCWYCYWRIFGNYINWICCAGHVIVFILLELVFFLKLALKTWSSVVHVTLNMHGLPSMLNFYVAKCLNFMLPNLGKDNCSLLISFAFFWLVHFCRKGLDSTQLKKMNQERLLVLAAQTCCEASCIMQESLLQWIIFA